MSPSTKKLWTNGGHFVFNLFVSTAVFFPPPRREIHPGDRRRSNGCIAGIWGCCRVHCAPLYVDLLWSDKTKGGGVASPPISLLSGAHCPLTAGHSSPSSGTTRLNSHFVSPTASCCRLRQKRITTSPPPPLFAALIVTAFQWRVISFLGQASNWNWPTFSNLCAGGEYYKLILGRHRLSPFKHSFTTN